jgi:excisionase family DNA binding protein
MELLTAAEVANLLKVSSDRVYAMAREGLIPTIHLGRHLRFDAAALKEWAAKGGQAFPGGWRREAQ